MGLTEGKINISIVKRKLDFFLFLKSIVSDLNANSIVQVARIPGFIFCWHRPR